MIIPERWAIVRLRFTGPYAYLELRDQAGARVVTEASWNPARPLRLPFDPVSRHLSKLVSDLPLPVFIDLPRTLWGQGKIFDDLSRRLLIVSGVAADRFQFALFGGSRTPSRTPFSLPFNVLAVGERAEASIKTVAATHWANDDAVRELGFVMAMDPAAAESSAGLEAALRLVPRDVLITSDIATAVNVCRNVPIEMRPRLIIGLGNELLAPPRGTALVVLKPLDADPRVEEILLNVVHDRPIHEAVKAASTKFPGALRLVADPWTNQSLRMRDAAIDVLTQVERLQIQLPSVALDAYLSREAQHIGGIGGWVETRLPSHQQQQQQQQQQRAPRLFWSALDGRRLTSDAPVYDAFRSVGNQAVQLRVALPGEIEGFMHESTSVIPLARSALKLRQMHDVLSEYRTASASITNDDSAFCDMLSSAQRRVIDVALQRLESTPLLQSVDAKTTLAAGLAYRLRVHAGNQEPDSLVSGPRVPVDPLLPPTDDEGHLLDVVVQAKDFSLESPRTRQTRLPPFGASQPVYFTVRAPKTLGRASLRVHVYYKNHLIQSFLLEADIAAGEQPAERQTGAQMVYTRVDRLVLDEIQPRAFSLGANDSGSTHGFVLKGSGASGEVVLDKDTFKSYVDRFRTTLDAASRDPFKRDEPRLYASLAPGAPVPLDVATVIRDFARSGRDLYDALFAKAARDDDAMRAQLVDLQDQRDQRVQVVRFDDTFVFPWVLLYDFLAPKDWTSAPVCLGVVQDASGNVTPCTHGPNSRVVCANGFWGIRHMVEEVIGKGTNIANPVFPPSANAVRVVTDDTVKGADALKTAIQGIAPTQYQDGPTSEQQLLDLLWRVPSERPAILVVLGHMDGTGGIAGAGTARIELVPEQEWLTRAELSGRASREKTSWSQPKPIVMLMACESAATTSETVNDFVSALTVAGASAIIGTEAIVTGPFAAACAQTLVNALWTMPRKTLGEAMVSLRRELLTQGNPLAFVLHAVGNVDLSIS